MSDLADTVTDAKNPTKVRSIAALAIGNIGAGAKPVVPALAKALKKSEPLEVRQSAAEALSKIQYPANEAAIPALLDTVENDPEPKVRQRCVWSLFGMTPDKARACGADKTLAKLLDEPDGRLTLVRYDAARALAFQLGPDAPDQTVDVLLHMLRNKAIKVFSGTDVKVNGPGKGPRDSNVRVNRTASGDARHMAAQALARLGQKAARNPAAIKALKEAVKDSDSKLSGAARAALNRLKINAEDTPTHRKEPPVRDPRPS